MTRLTLERHQVWIYLVAIAAGLAAGRLCPDAGEVFGSLLWPVLALLLFAAFVQVPLLRLGQAFADRRFALASILGNFMMLPALVWLLVQWLPDDPVLRTGVLLVLLVPCTDWFIAFTQLGGGDVSRAMAITPVNLALQLLLLPLYLWLMTGTAPTLLFDQAALAAVLAVIGLPLLAALAAGRWIAAAPGREALRERLAWWPVPLLALAVCLVAAAQGQAIRSVSGLLPWLVPVFVVFLLAAALLARILTAWFALPVAQGRTLAFGFGTRNSFLVLPLALALPAGRELAAAVVVVQSLVELLGMAFFLWWVPRRLLR